MAPREAPRYRAWPEVSRGMLHLAHDRTSYLLTPHPLAAQSLKTMLANAYLQGVADCAETSADMMHRKGLDPAASDRPKPPEGLS